MKYEQKAAQKIYIRKDIGRRKNQHCFLWCWCCTARCPAGFVLPNSLSDLFSTLVWGEVVLASGGSRRRWRRRVLPEARGHTSSPVRSFTLWTAFRSC